MQNCRGLKLNFRNIKHATRTTPVQNCRGLKLLLAFRHAPQGTTPVQNCRGLKPVNMSFIFFLRTTPVQNCRGLKRVKIVFYVRYRTTPVQNCRGVVFYVKKAVSFALLHRVRLVTLILNCIKMKKLPEKIPRELLYISEHCVIYFCDKVKTAS